MKSLFTLLLFCFCLSVATAQTTKKKTSVPAKKQPAATKKVVTTTAVKKPASTTTTVTSTTVATATAQPAASTLTFPSTEPENVTTMDAAKKQQMYDELHGIKVKPTTPDTGKKGSKAPRTRSTEEVATRTDQRVVTSSANDARSYIGIRAGGNYSTLLEQPFGVTIDPTYGFHAGLVFQFGRGGVAFQPEVNFVQNYFKVGTETVTSSSLVVPLLAKFQFGEQGSTRFFINVGPYGVYSLDSRPADSDLVISYGGALGLGVGIPAGSGKFTIEARGYYDLGSTAAGSKFGDVYGKPIMGQLSLGYLFPIGSR